MAMKPRNDKFQMLSVAQDNYGYYSRSYYPCGGNSLGAIVTQMGDFHSPTPHSYTKNVFRGYLGSIAVVGFQYTFLRSGAMPYVYNYNGHVPTSFDDAARTLCLKDAYEALRGSVDLSVDLVQWRNMMQMVNLKKRLITAIARQAKHLVPTIERAEKLSRELRPRRGRRPVGSRARRLTRELNSSLNWLAERRLEYSYGWRPTIKTLQELGQQTARRAGEVIKVEGKGRTRDTFQRKEYSISANCPVVHTVNVSNRCRCVMFFTPQPSMIDSLQRITSLNPASIFYEAMPFSFVLDWVVDFSGWLRTLETAFVHQNDFAGGYMTQTMRTTVDSSMQGTEGPQTTLNNTYYNLQGTAVVTKFSRSMLTSAPFPRKPVVALNFGLERSLNAASLAKATLLRADKLLSKRK